MQEQLPQNDQVDVDIIDCNDLEIILLPTKEQLDRQIAQLDCEIIDLDAEVDDITAHLDKVDYIVAGSSGILSGLVDILFFNLNFEKEWDIANDKLLDGQYKIAKIFGYKGKNDGGQIAFLEEKFGMPSDSVTSKFGGGRQHHLRDFSHHVAPHGLFFSILTQFTKYAYGTDEYGVFKREPILNTTFIGKTIPEKLLYGVIYWFLHIASDMAGSSNNPGSGTGVPGPILSIIKLLSAKWSKKNRETMMSEIGSKLSKAFNGTLFAVRDENKKIVKPQKMDLRGEIAIRRHLSKQMFPTLLNEAIVKGCYFIRRLVVELKNKKNLRNVDWEYLCNFNNRTVQRMMSISTAVFSAVDLIGCATTGSLLNINVVGVGRMAISIGTDCLQGIKREKLAKERLSARAQLLHTLNAKIFLDNKLLWQAANNNENSAQELENCILQAQQLVASDYEQMQKGIQAIAATDVLAINEHNPHLLEDIGNILNNQDTEGQD